MNIPLDGSDAENDALTYAISIEPQNGIVEIDTNGFSANYTPDEHFFGTDTFQYTASDGNSTSTPGLVTIQVNSILDKPEWLLPFNVTTTFPVDEDTSGDIIFAVDSIEEVQATFLFYQNYNTINEIELNVIDASVDLEYGTLACETNPIVVGGVSYLTCTYTVTAELLSGTFEENPITIRAYDTSKSCLFIHI